MAYFSCPVDGIYWLAYNAYCTVHTQWTARISFLFQLPHAHQWGPYILDKVSPLSVALSSRRLSNQSRRLRQTSNASKAYINHRKKFFCHLCTVLPQFWAIPPHILDTMAVNDRLIRQFRAAADFNRCPDL